MSSVENENILDSELINFCISESLVIIYQYTNVFLTIKTTIVTSKFIFVNQLVSLGIKNIYVFFILLRIIVRNIYLESSLT